MNNLSDIALILASFAKAGILDNELFSLLGKRAALLLDTQSSIEREEDLVSILWSFAKLGLKNEILFDNVSEWFIRNRRKLALKQLSDFIWSFASLGFCSNIGIFEYSLEGLTSGKLDLRSYADVLAICKIIFSFCKFFTYHSLVTAPVNAIPNLKAKFTLFVKQKVFSIPYFEKNIPKSLLRDLNESLEKIGVNAVQKVPFSVESRKNQPKFFHKTVHDLLEFEKKTCDQVLVSRAILVNEMGNIQVPKIGDLVLAVAYFDQECKNLIWKFEEDEICTMNPEKIQQICYLDDTNGGYFADLIC